VFLTAILVLGGGILALVLWPPPGPPEPIKITIASSSTKKEWLNQAVLAFNEESRTKRDFQYQNRPILVEILLEEIEPGVRDHYRSGTMVQDILARVIEPTIASPAEQSWIQKLNQEWPGRKPITSDEGPGLVRTPLVIAMWRSRAEALGCWPTAGPDCTWRRLRVLAASADGWGTFGHPEWGRLKYGYGYVGRSNSATFTEVLNCMSGLQKNSRLTLDEVRRDADCGEAMAALEKAEIRIAEKSEWLLRWMRERGPPYLDAVTTYEEEVIEINAEYGPTLTEQIVAVYPQDGTILATHPFTILAGAPWVMPEQVKASEIFRQFLLSRQQQSLLLRYGFRPADVAVPLGPRIDPTYGANPQANLVLVEVPHSQVIDAIVKLWERIRTQK
jgi:Ca-activated chloride channel family protein